MGKTFIEKQQSLLSDLKKLALMHNRDYFLSIIPFVESATPDQEELLDTYQLALDEDRNRLMQSRGAFVTPERVNSII
jgi:hypothetical protein